MKLVVQAGPDRGQEFPVSGLRITIGRGPDNEIVLHDDTVSRKHAAITQSTGTFVITDLNSRNGTFVNGVRISAPQPLRQGDRIQIGETMLSVEEGVVLPMEKAKPVPVARAQTNALPVIVGGVGLLAILLLVLMLWPPPPPVPTPTPTATAMATWTFAVATATPVPTKTPVPPSPTSAPTTAPTLLAAPVLEAPAYGESLYAVGTLRWHWQRALKADEYFDVRVWKEGQPHYGIAWTKDTWFEIKGLPGGKYYWSILVLRHTGTKPDGTKEWVAVSEESEVRHFFYSPPSPPPTDTPIPVTPGPTPPPYPYPW